MHGRIRIVASPFAVSSVDRGWLQGLSRSSRILLAVLILGFCSLLGIGDAHSQERVPRFCYQGFCYPTLQRAEAELRANAGPYGSLWKKAKTQHYMDSVEGPVFRIEYKVDDHVPSVLYPAGYVVGSMLADDGICSPVADPHEARRCADEAEGVAGAMARYRSIWPTCTFVEQGYEGRHGEPYVSVRNTYGYGAISFRATGAEKGFRYTIQCPGWEAPDSRVHHIVKTQNFDCPVGFQPKHADNPAYYSWGTGVEWPLLCEPTMPSQDIFQWNTTQTCSAATTNNPCFPATGDKARSEVDFTFAGREFTRHYHSLNQLQIAAELGQGWSHNYADFLMSTRRVRIDESGYLQSYAYSGRGNQAYGELVRIGSAGNAELLKADGTVRSYRADGRLANLVTGDPRTSVSVIYDARSRIDRITDGTGRSLQFEYADGHLSSIALPDGSKAAYSYDVYGNLTRVIRPDGSTRTYVYGEAEYAPADFHNLMTGIIEGSTRYATFSYGQDGKVVGSYLLADGQPVDAGTITYNPGGTVTTTNELGEVSQLEIGGREFRAITKSVNSRGASSLVVDDFGRRKSQVDAAGARTTWSYTDTSSGVVTQVVTRTEEAIGRVNRTTRGASNRVVEQRVSQKVAGGEQLTSLHRQAYDAQGHLLFSCQYDATQSTDYVCGSLATAPVNVRQFRNSYCTDADAAANPALCPLSGLQLSARNPAGALTQFEYYAVNDAGCDASGDCRFRKGDLRAEIDALGRRTEYLEYDAFGRAVQVRGIDGIVIEQLFDHDSRVLAVTTKGDVPANDRIRLYEYSSTGNLTKTTQPDGVWTRMHYDTADRLTSVEDAAGNRINYILDGAGNRLREEVRDSSGVLRRSLDRLFDTASRMTRVAGAAGQATQMRYDAVGNLLETENPLGTVSKSTYDGAGRPTKQIDDLGGINAEMRYEYAANGQVERVVDPKGLATTYAYDGFGQLATQTSPDTGVTQFTYDRLGNTLSRTDARDVTAQYEYDAAGRTTAVRFADPAADIQYVYDQPSAQCPVGERAGVGRLSSMIDSSGRTDYCYSPLGDLVRRVQVVEGQPLVLRYAYAPSGRLQSMTYPDGSLVDYGYDALGQVSSVGVTPAGGTREVLLQGAQTLPFGPEQSWTFGNGRRVDRSYDQDYRPLTISDNRDGLKVSFGFDGAGNIASLTDGGPQGQGATLDYDALGRLTAFKDAQTGVAIEQYSYDATGNRLSFGNSAGVQAYVYPAGSHRLMSVDGVDRTYDAMGNTLTIGGEWQYAYDLAGRLGSATRAGAAEASYRHNAAGQRVLQQAGNERNLHLYGEGGEWLGSYGAGGTPGQQVVWLGSKPVALIQAGKILYVESDHLGSPRAVIDPQRDMAVWRWSLLGEAFGSGLPAEDPDQDGVPQAFDLRFLGQRFDSASGLSYNYFRDYDSEVGRYVQSDPLGLIGGLSTYAYANQGPLKFVDPFGLAASDACRVAWVTTCAVGGGAVGFWGGGIVLGTAGSGVPVAGNAAGFVAGSQLGGMAGASAGGLVGQLTADMVCTDGDKKCPPCRTVDGRTILVGTIGYRLDIVPPSKPHYPYSGSHYNLYKANQIPHNCNCFWQPIGASDAAGGLPPPAGAVPMADFVK